MCGVCRLVFRILFNEEDRVSKLYDICVIGGGSGGLVMAAGASQMGAKVALIEADKMGGDCLNYGCVPSKALIAAAHSAQAMRTSGRFGVKGVEPEVDMSGVAAHIREVIETIAPNDSVERFTGLGVDVFEGRGELLSRREVKVGEEIVRAKTIVISTGSYAFIPPVPGLEDVDYFTNENIFDNSDKVDHLLVMGGGPIGLEMAQSYRRLGSRVSVVEMSGIMAKDDPEAVEVVRSRLLAEGLELHEGTQVVGVSKGKGGKGVILRVKKGDEESEIEGSHLLVAVGRRAKLEGLGLDEVGVVTDRGRIVVDERLRTSVKNIYAVGDVAGPYQFTHMAGYQAGIVIRNVLFKLPAKVDYHHVTWSTYTSPELASVGMSEEMAKEKLGSGGYRVLRWPFEENDRAVAEREREGFVKVIVDKKGVVLGALIVGEKAGELLGVWNVAVSAKLKIGSLAGMIVPYPTLSEASKRAAGSYYTPKIFSDRVRSIVRFLAKF